MPASPPAIDDLLGKEAHILLSTGRPGSKKRIVELAGQKYVLHRFGRLAAMRLFEETIGRLHQAGVPAQTIVARTRTTREAFRLGHWLALSYVPGELLKKSDKRIAFAALGRAMARLNGLDGPAYSAPFNPVQPKLPHETYLGRQRHALTDAQRRWIEESHARLRDLPATQLTHGDLDVRNIIRAADDAVTLIDYETLAYDLSGIELAGTFLRPFCKNRQKRQVLLDAYLETCPARLREIWEGYGADLLFAAAARFALARQDKVRLTAFRDRLAAVRQAVALPSRRQALAEQRQTNARIIAVAERRRAQYLAASLRMIDIAIAEPALAPLVLLERSETG